MSVKMGELVRRGSSLPPGTAMMANQGAVYRCKACDAEIIIEAEVEYEKRDEVACDRHTCK